MKKCKCGQPVEAERYQFCYNCWWDQDPRNEKNKVGIMTIFKVTTTKYVNNVGAIVSSAPTPVHSVTEKFFSDKNKAENYKSLQQKAIEDLGMLGMVKSELSEVRVED